MSLIQSQEKKQEQTQKQIQKKTQEQAFDQSKKMKQAIEKPIISVKNVSKVFRVPLKGQSFWKSLFYRKSEPVSVIKDISFDIREGEFIGYIGPNGAGKSTTIKLLTGILYPNKGDVSVLNFTPYSDRYEYTYNIGVVFGQRSLLEFDIPVIDSFILYKHIYELTDKDFNERVAMFTKMLHLEELLHVPVRKLSLGQRMRCEIAASLLHKPKIIFLDEPTIGLDAVAKEEIRKFLKDINRREKVTIILTTHDMDDIEELCDRIIFINKGAILFDGKLSKLKEKYVQKKEVTVTYGQEVKIPTDLKELLFEQKGLQATFLIPRNIVTQKIPELLKIGEAKDIHIKEQELEDIVKKIYRENE